MTAPQRTSSDASFQFLPGDITEEREVEEAAGKAIEFRDDDGLGIVVLDCLDGRSQSWAARHALPGQTRILEDVSKVPAAAGGLVVRRESGG